MPDKPILIYQIISEPVVVTQTVDQWESRTSMVFNQPRFTALSGSQHSNSFIEIPVPHQNLWESIPAGPPSRPRFMVVEAEEIPRTPTAVAETITGDKWESRASMVFARTRFLLGDTAESPTTTFPETPQIDKWDGQDGPVLNRPRFMVVEGEEIPKLGTTPAVTQDSWQSYSPGMVFTQRTFVHGESAPVPTTIFAEPPTLDKWQAYRQDMGFTRPRFMVPEAEEIPKLGTAAAATPDVWQSDRQGMVFHRQRFAGFASAQHVGGFTEEPFVPDLVTWQSHRQAMGFNPQKFMAAVEQRSASPVFGETIQIDKWDGQDAPVFNRHRFLVVEGEEIPRAPTAAGETITLDKWEARSSLVFSRPRFLLGDTAESPSTTFAEPILADKWESYAGAIFARPRFHALAGSQHSSGFVEIQVPHQNLWESIPASRPNFTKFVTVEAEELPRAPSVLAETLTIDKWDGQDGPIFHQRRFMPGVPIATVAPPDAPPFLLDRWQSPRTTEPFSRRRFMPGDVAESPTTIFVEPTRLDKWESRRSQVFSKSRFMVGQESRPITTLWIVPVSIDKWQTRRSDMPFTRRRFMPGDVAESPSTTFTATEIVTPPLIVFVAPQRPAAITSTVDVMTFTGPSRPAAVTSLARDVMFIAPVRGAEIVSAVDLMTFRAPGRPTVITSVAR